LLSAHNVRVPDLGVTCSPLLFGQATLPEPVLLIEILSPSNQAKTWSNVRATGEWPEEPEQLAGGDLALKRIDFLGPWPTFTHEPASRAALTRWAIMLRGRGRLPPFPIRKKARASERNGAPHEL
jgi:hypothetical protein